MIKKFLLAGFIVSLTFATSCKSDNDDYVEPLTIDEQNVADDDAILNLLNNYYFDDLGKITKFSDAITSKDKEALSKLNPKKDPSGFWYVINPKASVGEGTSPDGGNNILIHYTLNYFTATEGGSGYSTLYPILSTINGSGVAQENPYFYIKPKTDTVNTQNYYVINSLVNGLKKFKPTNKSKNDPYDVLQGAIIVPSRLAYARNSNYLGVTNATFILNFELYKVCPKEEICQ